MNINKTGKELAKDVTRAMIEFQRGAYSDYLLHGPGDYGFIFQWSGEVGTNKHNSGKFNLFAPHIVKFDEYRSGDFDVGDWIYSQPINGYVIRQKAWLPKRVIFGLQKMYDVHDFGVVMNSDLYKTNLTMIMENVRKIEVEVVYEGMQSLIYRPKYRIMD